MKLLYCIYQIVVALPVIIVVSIVCSLATVIGCLLGNASWWGYWPGKVWAVIVCRILLLPVRVKGREHLESNTSYVFVSNHQSYLDIFLIYGFLGHNFRWNSAASPSSDSPANAPVKYLSTAPRPPR